MKCVIVDDNKTDRQHLIQLIQNWSSNQKTPVLVSAREFSCARTLLFQLDRLTDAQVFFLTLDAENRDAPAFRLVKEIHEEICPVFIILVSEHAGFLPKDVQPLVYRFFKKPMDQEDVYATLDMIQASLLSSNYKTAVFHDSADKERHVVHLEAVTYIETQSRLHKATIHLYGQPALTVRMSYPAARLMSKQLNDDFIQCARGVLINRNYVKHWSDKTVSLYEWNNEISIKIGASFLEELGLKLEEYFGKCCE